MFKKSLSPVFFSLICALFIGAPGHVFADLRSDNLWWLPASATVDSARIDALFIFIFWLTMAVFVLVQGAMIYFMVKYRARKGVKAIYSHGSNALEIVWTSIPAAIFIGLVIYSNGLWNEILDGKRIPPDALNIEIVAEQYGFHIRYPGPDNILGKASDNLITNDNKLGLDPEDGRNKAGFVTYNEFNLPVNRAIHLHLRSRDVIHAFYVPEFRLYQDMVPGRTISWLWFQAVKQGNYVIACNQLCGAGHYNMQSKIKVMAPEDYEKWVQSKLPAPAATSSAFPSTVPAPVATASTVVSQLPN